MNLSIRSLLSVVCPALLAMATMATMPGDTLAGTVTRYEVLTAPSQLDGTGTIIFAGNNGTSQGNALVTVGATGGNIDFQPDSALGGIMGIIGGSLQNGGLSDPAITDTNLQKVAYDQDYNNGGALTITVPGLTVGQLSRLQLIFTSYSQNDRTYEIEVDGDIKTADLTGTHLWVYEWIATDDTANIAMITTAPTVGHGTQLAGFVVSQVPEPSSMALCGMAAASLMGFSRRFRRR